MTPRKFIREAFTSDRPVSAAVAILKTEYPEIRAMTDALFTVYLYDRYLKQCQSSFGEFIRKTERRRS